MERTQPLQKTFPGATARASRRKRRLAPSFQAQACASADKRRQAPSLEAQAPSSAGNPRRASRFTLESCWNRIYNGGLPPFSLVVSSCATPNEERSAEGRHQQEFKEEGTQEQQRVALAGACRRFAG